MVNRAGARASLALALALGALLVVGLAPVSAAVDSGCTGTCGYYEVYDNNTGMPGAKCTYKNSYPYKLIDVSPRAPLMHGYQADKDPVAWRFKVQRKNVNGGSWNTYFTSGYQSSMASDSIPAYTGHGFSRRHWTPPNNPNGYFWRVVLNLRWKADNGNDRRNGDRPLRVVQPGSQEWQCPEPRLRLLHSLELTIDKSIRATGGPADLVGPLTLPA